jgi:hypothetical protein
VANFDWLEFPYPPRKMLSSPNFTSTDEFRRFVKRTVNLMGSKQSVLPPVPGPSMTRRQPDPEAAGHAAAVILGASVGGGGGGVAHCQEPEPPRTSAIAAVTGVSKPDVKLGKDELKRDMVILRFLAGLANYSLQDSCDALEEIRRLGLTMDISVPTLQRRGLQPPLMTLIRGLCQSRYRVDLVYGCLMENGCDRQLNLPDSDGNTPLLLSIKVKNWSMIENLLYNATVDIHHRNNAGENALLCAIVNSNYQLAERLSSRPDIDWSVTDRDGRTALILAVCVQHTQMVDLILQSFPAVDLDAKDSSGRTALSRSANVEPYIGSILRVAKNEWIPKYLGAADSVLEWATRHTFPRPIRNLVLYFLFENAIT